MFKMYSFLVVFVLLQDVSGHGMMINPVGRSSVWRFYSGYPVNYNDNQNFCGGAWMYISSGGQCGVCGDPYTDPHPQPNENTGTYGNGKITGTYKAGSIIDVTVVLTANHMGEFTYSLCELTDSATYESGESCFVPLKLEGDFDKYIVQKSDYTVVNRVKLPEDFSCSRCVLRWNYKTGNSWGVCDDGTQGLGCGLQETFRSCADIAII